jgi:hypothetical protein
VQRAGRNGSWTSIFLFEPEGFEAISRCVAPCAITGIAPPTRTTPEGLQRRNPHSQHRRHPFRMGSPFVHDPGGAQRATARLMQPPLRLGCRVAVP